MPVYVKPKNKVCQERAENDANFYYKPFEELLLQDHKEALSSETRQQLLRLNKWVMSYKAFAFRYHFENFVQANDIYADPDDAIRFPINNDIPNAPFLEVFEEIDGNN
jgi:hypothetical protein